MLMLNKQKEASLLDKTLSKLQIITAKVFGLTLQKFRPIQWLELLMLHPNLLLVLMGQGQVVQPLRNPKMLLELRITRMLTRWFTSSSNSKQQLSSL